MLMLDRTAVSMAKNRRDRRHSQRKSQTPSVSRSKPWSGVYAIPPLRSHPGLTTNTKRVFGEDNNIEPSPLLTGHSIENAWSADKNKVSRTVSNPTVKRTSDSDSIRKTHDRSLNDESSIYDSAKEDINAARPLKEGINDVIQQKGKKTTKQGVNSAVENQSRDYNTGKETDGASESEEQKETSPQRLEATDQGTPSPSQLTNSSLQKLNQAKAAALEQKKLTNLPLSASQNVLHAHSPIESSKTRKTPFSDTNASGNTCKTPSSPALASSPSTTLVQAADNLGSWRASQDITMPSTPPTHSSGKKMKDSNSKALHRTFIEAPKTYGAPPGPPSRRASSTQQAQRDAEARISDVWGKKFASQRLVIEPFQTFSSKASTFDVDSSSDDEYLDKVKNGNLVKSNEKKKEKTADCEKKTNSRKTKQKPEQGWDAVLAEARFQAERLQKRKIEMDKLRGTENAVARQKMGKAGKAGKKKKSQKDTRGASILQPVGANDGEKDKKEEPSKTSKKRKHSEIDATDEPLENPRKRRKGDEKSKKDKKRKRTKNESRLPRKRHSKERCRSNETDNSGVGKSEEFPGDHKKNKVTEEKPDIDTSNTKIPILTDLRDLLPRAVLSSAARTMNDAEILRSAAKVAKMQRKEQRKIEKGKLRPVDAIWQGLDVESAQKNNLIDEVKTFEETHDVVVIRAAVGLIRALSQNAVVAGMRNVADGGSSHKNSSNLTIIE